MGTAEVVGDKAGIIIANPNGITCAGCGFINADRVDLVTGTYNTTTGTYSISDNDVNVDGGGLLASTVGVLNIQTNNFSNSSYYPGVSADTFNLSLAGDFNTFESSEIFVNTFNLSLAGDFNPVRYSNIIANTFNFSVSGDFDHIVSYSAAFDTFHTNSEGRITVNALNLNVGGDFTFSNSANNFIWRANDNLTVSGSANINTASFNNSGTITVNNSSFDITATNFTNTGTISANSFNATVDTFSNETGARITAGECNLVVHTISSDNGTITCLNSDTIEATVDNIAQPTAGLSDNSYETFHIPRNGVVFNNSDSAGTSQLLGDISKNPNYNDGDAASIILAQVTSLTDISLLLGTLEVFGAEAVVIIANPNGISCNACSFINASRVDLVTASSYNAATNRFNNITNTNIAIIDNGLDASDVDILNIRAGSFTNTGVLEANILNLSIDGDFDYTQRGIINATSFNLTVGGNFTNDDASSDFIWATNDSLTVLGNADITANSFNNSGNISADTFDLSVVGDFDYADRSNVTTNNFNLDVGGNFSNNNASDDFVLATNDSLSISGDFTIDTNHYIQFGTLVVDGTLAIIAERNFFNSGSITTDSLEITAGYIAINQGSIVSGNLDLTAADFFRNLTGGDIAVDNFVITAGGKVTNTANITVGTLTITANNDSTRDNDTTGFYVSNRGNIIATTLNIAAVDNFYNRGNITATNFTTSAKSVFFLNREIDSFYAAGHTYDGGNISLAGDSSFIADGGIIENYGNIDLGGFDLIVVADSFTNYSGATITADTLNLTVSSFVQDGSIDATIDQ